MSNFSERLKQLREEKGVTQKEMAEILKLSPRGYQAYEYKGHYPAYKGLLFLADFFNVSLDYLTGRSDVREIAR